MTERCREVLTDDTTIHSLQSSLTPPRPSPPEPHPPCFGLNPRFQPLLQASLEATVSSMAARVSTDGAAAARAKAASVVGERRRLFTARSSICNFFNVAHLSLAT